jgi:hypothetical protein
VIFDDPFTGKPIDVPGVDLDNVFARLVEEPTLHDSDDPMTCSLCRPLLIDAMVADFHDELEEAS